ncbi:MAG: peptide deformylase [Planctomycetota bacterium]|nr:peptide deformylase [Planctomycetota bacterium]
MDIDPANLEIVVYPDPILKQTAKPVQAFDKTLQAVAVRMIELMYDADGIGLAAPQVGLPWRLFVTRPPEDDPNAQTQGAGCVYVNPTMQITTRDMDVHEEGCLSLPGIRVDIRRPIEVTLQAMEVDGQPVSLSRDDFMARVWQHEIDHLNGVLIIDKMNPMDRIARRKDIKELERDAQR